MRVVWIAVLVMLLGGGAGTWSPLPVALADDGGGE